MTSDTSQPQSRALALAVAVLSLACIGVAVVNASVGFFRESDPDGTWHVQLWNVSFVALPLAFLLFAFGVQCSARRRPVLAVAAMLPLVAWIGCIRIIENVLANDVYVALVGLQFQGLNPFGGS